MAGRRARRSPGKPIGLGAHAPVARRDPGMAVDSGVELVRNERDRVCLGRHEPQHQPRRGNGGSGNQPGRPAPQPGGCRAWQAQVIEAVEPRPARWVVRRKRLARLALGPAVHEVRHIRVLDATPSEIIGGDRGPLVSLADPQAYAEASLGAVLFWTLVGFLWWVSAPNPIVVTDRRPTSSNGENGTAPVVRV